MTNNDMLANIEYLREKADVSYEEAEALLAKHDGNVMRVLVELEHQGRVYAQQHTDGTQKGPAAQRRCDYNDTKEKATSFINRAFQTRLIVEKKQEDDQSTLVANVAVPFAVGFTLLAPWLTVATVAVAFVTGHNVKIEKEKPAKKEA